MGMTMYREGMMIVKNDDGELRVYGDVGTIAGRDAIIEFLKRKLDDVGMLDDALTMRMLMSWRPDEYAVANADVAIDEYNGVGC